MRGHQQINFEDILEKTKLDGGLDEAVSITTFLDFPFPWIGLLKDKKRKVSRIKIETEFHINTAYGEYHTQVYTTETEKEKEKARGRGYFQAEKIPVWPDKEYKTADSALTGHCKTIENIKRTYVHYTEPTRTFLKKQE